MSAMMLMPQYTIRNSIISLRPQHIPCCDREHARSAFVFLYPIEGRRAIRGAGRCCRECRRDSTRFDFGPGQGNPNLTATGFVVTIRDEIIMGDVGGDPKTPRCAEPAVAWVVLFDICLLAIHMDKIGACGTNAGLGSPIMDGPT